MMNEQTFTLHSENRDNGYDVEVFDLNGSVWVRLDPYSSNDTPAREALSPTQARDLAAALLRFADRASGK